MHFRRWIVAGAAALALTAVVEACSSDEATQGGDADGGPTPYDGGGPAFDTGAPGPVPDGSADAGAAVTVTFAATSNRPVNRKLLGTNVQWTDRGDGLVDDAGALVASEVALLARTGATVVRYPGGTLADAYRLGATSGVDLNGQTQPVVFGLSQLVALCTALGAQPAVTVNTFSADENEAAAWMSVAIDAGVPVAYWEVGNEPYLKSDVYADGGADTTTPADFVARANTFLTKMRATDPTARLSIPMRMNQLDGKPVVDKPGYLDAVLAGVTVPFDLASIHDAYLPLDLPGDASASDMYLAATASALALGEFLDAYRTKLDTAYPGHKVNFALSEWHPFFTVATLAAIQSGAPQQELLAALDEDLRADSIAGAIYVVDLLRVLSYRDDVEVANLWSAAQNYVFGAISTGHVLRTPALALEAASKTLRGDLVDVTIAGAPTIATPEVGYVHAFPAVRAVEALAAREGAVTRALLVNKDPASSIAVRLGGVTPGVPAPVAQVLVTNDPLAHDENAEATWSPLSVTDGVVTLPAHAIVRVVIGGAD